MINPVNNVKISAPLYPLKKGADASPVSNYANSQNVSSPLIQKSMPPLKIVRSGNVSRISFKGRMQDPLMPAIQMKVRGVSQHQKDFGSTKDFSRDRNVEKLANSNWSDGKRLDFKVVKDRDVSAIAIIDPNFGELGRVPDEIAPVLVPLLQKHGRDFEFQLSNVIAGTSKSAPTIGLRTNLIYKGNNANVKKQAQDAFDSLLNSNDKAVKACVLQYQPKASPSEVLQRIFDIKKEKDGPEAVKALEEVINTVSDELNNPENKNILLLGHCLPDGDTIGCVLGMHAAIKSKYPDKNVQCSIDDKLPGLFREKLPGVENIKRPYNADSIKEIKQNIQLLKSGEQTPSVKKQLSIYEKELSYLNRSESYFDFGIKSGEEPQKYDLVILMDIPSPSRFSTAYKDYIENAGKVIYIDHHPYHYEEWNSAKAATGLDMDKVRENNLALVIPEVPAATQIVTMVADNAHLLKKTLRSPDYAKQFTAGIVSGTSSDTGSFLRTANLTPDDVKKPVRERPNFMPEGMAKWLISKMGNLVDKKWIRENIVYDISDKTSSITSKSPRQKMLDYSLQGMRVYSSNGVGFVSVDYDKMYDIWESAKQDDEKVTFSDVQNSLKYSEVMGSLRESPLKGSKGASVTPYESPYQDDKIAVLLIQDKQKGCLDSNSKLAEKNGIRMSFRSQEGTIYAELLASLFGGGGHGGAAGGRIDIDGVKLDSKMAIKLDGKIEQDASVIYNALKENYAIKKNNAIAEKDKAALTHKFEPVLDENGKTVYKLINSIVTCIRADKSE